MSRALSFRAARNKVLEATLASRTLPAVERVPPIEADGRVLASTVHADRDFPALDRSARDGFALRSSDMPGSVRIVGEVQAGRRFRGVVHRGEAVEIMTGAPVPEGADTIVMTEHAVRSGETIRFEGDAPVGQFINYRGGEARNGALLLSTGRRLGIAEVALLAAAGCAEVLVYKKPTVSILVTGDEIVEPHEHVEPHQIRNSNGYSLAAQVGRAGGIARVLPIARDERLHTRKLIEQGLESDLLLISGGVSAGKYDVVEEALRQVGAQFFFDRVAIQPGQPLVFGKAQEKFFFGLPGNPASTMVTFELFANPALEILGGGDAHEIVVTFARLARPYKHRGGLTRFLPAVVTPEGELAPVEWTGSSDIASLTRGNAFMMVDPDRTEWAAGEWMPVFLR